MIITTIYLLINHFTQNHILLSIIEYHMLIIYNIVFSDTAAVYNNELYIKEALKVLLPKYHLKREDLFITSKLGK